MTAGAEFERLLSSLGREADEVITIGYSSAHAFSTVAKVPALVNPNGQQWFSAYPIRGPLGIRRDRGPRSRGTAEDAVGLRSLGVDIDDEKNGSTECGDRLIRSVANLFEVGPSAVVHSGHGRHFHWRTGPLDWSFGDADRHAYAATVARAFGATVDREAARLGVAVDRTTDLARQWRVPGSVNAKPGRATVLVRLLDVDPSAGVLDPAEVRLSSPEVHAVPRPSPGVGAPDLFGEPCEVMDAIRYRVDAAGDHESVLRVLFVIVQAAVNGHPGADVLRRRARQHYVLNVRAGKSGAESTFDRAWAGALRKVREQTEDVCDCGPVAAPRGRGLGAAT